MARFKTFVNGGSILPSDLNAIEDDYENAFAQYRSLRVQSMRLDAPAASGANPLIVVDGYSGVGQASGSGALSGLGVIYVNPADYGISVGANARTVNYNLQVSLATNATAIGAVTLTAGLYAISSVAGAAATVVATLAAAPVTGSTVAFTSPAASVTLNGSSGDFAAPAAGYFAIAVAVSAAAAANSSVALAAALRVRQV